MEKGRRLRRPALVQAARKQRRRTERTADRRATQNWRTPRRGHSAGRPQRPAVGGSDSPEPPQTPSSRSCCRRKGRRVHATVTHVSNVSHAVVQVRVHRRTVMKHTECWRVLWDASFSRRLRCLRACGQQGGHGTCSSLASLPARSALWHAASWPAPQAAAAHLRLADVVGRRSVLEVRGFPAPAFTNLKNAAVASL